jgi:hypothetical protein
LSGINPIRDNGETKSGWLSNVTTFALSELRTIRARSITRARALGYAANDSLPLLGTEFAIRSASDLRTRMLCISAVLWRAAGLSEDAVLEWLEQESLLKSLTPKERQFLADPESEPTMSARADGLFGLTWSAGLIDDFDFSTECPDTLVELFPDVRKGHRSAGFGKEIAVRDPELIVAHCDLAYCLHWSVRNQLVQGQPRSGKLDCVYLVERRRAFEWMLSSVGWDEVSLDT